MAIHQRNTELAEPTQPSKPSTVAEKIVQQLELYGVEHIYGVSGDAILELMHVLGNQQQIQFVATASENGAAMMASTEWKCRQKLAVCVGTSGPGLTNMLNGMADAAADHVPLLVITGQVDSQNIGTEAKQYVQQQQMISPLAVYTAELHAPDSIMDILKRAMIEAIDKRGVAHITIPKDLFKAPCTPSTYEPVGILNNAEYQDLHQMDQALMLLGNAHKPLILIGEGARDGRAEIVSLADQLQAGIISTLGAVGIVESTHPLYLGGIGEGGNLENKELLQQSDCVLALGANWWPQGFVPQDTRVIQVDRSPAAIEAHQEVHCGLVGNVRDIVPTLQEKLKELKLPANGQKEWGQKVKQTVHTMRKMIKVERKLDQRPIAPQRLIASIDQTVNEDAIIALDTGDHTLWFNRIFQAKQQDVLYSGKWRTMGYGLPAAISAQLNNPQKQVVAIIGDGCFQMTQNELATAVRHKLPITFIVLNNGALAMEKNKMLSEGLTPFGVDLYNPNFSNLARAYGAKGKLVIENEDIIPALEEALTADIPYVLDVHVSDIAPPLTGTAK